MPYIKSNDDRRRKLQDGDIAQNAGELNYQIFYYLKHYTYKPYNLNNSVQVYIFVNNFLGNNPNYQKYNDMTGALIRCKKELERRVGLYNHDFLIDIMDSYDNEIAKYEDKKIIENGDVE
jgi:hypothetical protein